MMTVWSNKQMRNHKLNFIAWPANKPQKSGKYIVTMYGYGAHCFVLNWCNTRQQWLTENLEVNIVPIGLFSEIPIFDIFNW